MAKPVVAIVGRPNVGKSTLFNHLIGKRKAIVEDVPGVTRDRLYDNSDWAGREFIIIDTGGIRFEEGDDILLDNISLEELRQRSGAHIYTVDGSARSLVEAVLS